MPELPPVTSTDGRDFMAVNSRKQHATRIVESSSALEDGHGEAIVTLGADGLQRGGRDSGIAGHRVEHFARALNRSIGAGSLSDGAVADYVVDDDKGAGSGKLDSPFQVPGIVGFVGVNEDEVERSKALLFDQRQGIEGGAHADLDAIGQTCTFNIEFGDFGVFRAEFEGNQAAAGS